MPSGRPSIGVQLHCRVDQAIRSHPELGYQTTAELVKDLLRRWLEVYGEEAKATHVGAIVVENGHDRFR